MLREQDKGSAYPTVKGITYEESSERTPIEPLTERELEVLQLMGYGSKNSEIAVKLFVSEGTIKTHVHHIIQKLRVEDRTQFEAILNQAPEVHGCLVLFMFIANV